MKKNQNVLRSEQLVVLSFFVVVCIIIGILNPQSFFTFNTLFDLLKNSTVSGMFAISVLLVLIYGGVDLSFSAIGAFSSYVAVKIINQSTPEFPFIVILLVCVTIGLILGSFNALLLSATGLPILVITLGTSTMYYGFLLFFIDNKIIMKLPEALVILNRSNLITVETSLGKSNLHLTILVLLALATLTTLMLRYTKIGRRIFAVGGGGRSLATRVGVNVRSTDYFVFGLAGSISAVAGLCNATLFRYANPVAFRGEELDIVAAVVIGGASINGGKGSVISTLIGVFLISLIKNNLIMIGIPSSWQRAIIGLIIIAGTWYNIARTRTGVSHEISI